MNENEKSISLFEADLYNYFYVVEKNRQKNTVKTVFIETIKIVASIFVTLIINLVSEKIKIDELSITVGATIIFTIIYAAIQIVTFSSKKIYNAIYNKRSREEVLKINELLFQKIATNYMSKAISMVNELENVPITEKDMCINYIEIAIKYFEKSKNAFREVFPDEESNKQGKREKANAIYLSHIGYAEIKLFFDSSQKSLNKLLLIAKPITTNYNHEISELLTYFQTKLPRIKNLESIYNTLK